MTTLLTHADLIFQGAEAKVYKVAVHHPTPSSICIKHRFPKQYRHPTLNATLSRSRLQAEARVLVRCLRAGVNVPGVRLVDLEAGLLGTEWIDGLSVRRILGGEDEGVIEEDEEEDASPDEPEVDHLAQFQVTQDQLMGLIGKEIGKLHLADIVHGDLTTSNMILRDRAEDTPAELTLIDFGLSFTSTLVEDKAVDLYVLERAFASTHPDSEHFFAAVLDEYARTLGKAWQPVYRRLEDGACEQDALRCADLAPTTVRMRGRKRSMVG
ncbi:kinase-like domain-containing protein [Auriculariales sp. MPI-PUGE-AT-0066]|nr:kinase-like domain-containing protein [Auriculariales sp. MPI-PUGE-AT-0066]